MKRIGLSKIVAPLLLGAGLISTSFVQQSILNVSYDPTRELYQDYDKVFAPDWKKKNRRRYFH